MIRSLLLALSLAGSAHAIRIELDYTYDTTGFFNRPGAKAALRAVADFYESIIHDPLARIDRSQWSPINTWEARFYHPATDQVTGIPNLVVPENTLIIFAGGGNLGGAAGLGGPGFYSASGIQGWFDLIAARGQAGALTNPRTDFGPWGGSISFDTSLNWNFSTSTPSSSTTSFIPIALHEIGHLLGIGLAQSWNAKIVGANFTGMHSILSFGGVVPLEPDGGHWRNDGACSPPFGHNSNNPNNVLSRAFGSFQTPHGHPQIALMDPQNCELGPVHKVMTDLDLAGLRDIGWQIRPPLVLYHTNLKPLNGALPFSWPSTSGITYRLERSTSLAGGSWNPLQTSVGNGDLQSFTDNHPPPSRAFYRLNTSPPVLPAKISSVPADYEPAPASMYYPRASGCRCGHR